MAEVLIDTDVLIDFLRGRAEAIGYIQGVDLPAYISAITVAELFAGVREGNERTALERFLGAFDIVSADDEIARRGGLFRRDFGKSHAVSLPDALIAATAELRGLPLVTLNRKHFPMLANVQVPYQKTS